VNEEKKTKDAQIMELRQKRKCTKGVSYVEPTVADLDRQEKEAAKA
jgi:hypothetical protein